MEATLFRSTGFALAVLACACVAQEVRAEEELPTEQLLIRALEAQQGCADVTHALSECASEADDSTLHGLAALLWEQGRAAEAAPLFERALGLRQQRTGASDLSMLPLWTGLAMAYRDSGDYANSRAIAGTAVALAQTHAAEQTARAASAFVVLGSLLESQGRLEQAEEWIGRGLKIREQLFEPGSVAVADALVFQGTLYRHARRWPEAAAALQRAVQIYEWSKMPDKAATTRLNWGRALADAGKTKDAERVYRAALAGIGESGGQSGGRSNPEVATGWSALGSLLSSRHRYAEAESLFQRALELDRAHFPGDDPRIALDLSNQGVLAVERKQYGEAEARLLESAALLERRYPGGNVEIGKVTARLAELRRRQGRTEEAARLYEKAVQILEAAWGADDPRLLATLESYSQTLRAARDFVGAGRVDLQTMRIKVIQARAKAHAATRRPA